MNTIIFDWTYLSGVRTAHTIVRKYMDIQLGVYKEEFEHRSMLENLFYIPSDSHTFSDEEHLIKRINIFLNEKNILRGEKNLAGNNVTFVSFFFSNGELVYKKLASFQMNESRKYSCSNGKEYNTLKEFIENSTNIKLLFTNGKIGILRNSGNK